MIERQVVDNTPAPIKKWLRMPYDFIGETVIKASRSQPEKMPRFLDISAGNGVNQDCLMGEVWSVDYHDNQEAKLERYTRVDLNVPDLRLPFEDKFFDFVVSFETIEHLNEENHVGFVKELLRVSTYGVLCGTVATDGVDVLDGFEIYKASLGTNEFHLKEYSCDEFVKFFTEFDNIYTHFLYGHHPSYKIVHGIPDKATRKEELVSMYVYLSNK